MRTIAAFTLSLCLAAPLAAQQPAPGPGEQLVDRVVAVVGDTTILLSDLQADLGRMQAEGEHVPTDQAGISALMQQLLQRHVDDVLLVEGARAAGINVLDAEVAQAVDRQVAQVRQTFKSEAEFNQALAQSGRTMEDYRRQLTDQMRSQGMVQRFEQQRFARMARPRVTDEEARALFESQREQLGQRPANISFQQAIVTPAASDTAKAAARKQAEDILAQLRAGGDFEVLARRFSADPGSKERGGDLGWFRQGQMVRPFEAMAFALRPGDLAPAVVETDYGFHIIRVDKARGPERSAHHILIAPAVHPADVERARVRADSVAAAVRAGASLTDLAAKVKTQADQVVAQHQELDKLPAEYTLAFQNAAIGQVVGPFQIEPSGRPAFVVARVTGRQSAGLVAFEDVAELARQRLVERKQEQQLVQELRGEIPISIVP